MKLTFQVTGMTCAACSARVEKVTGQVPGVRKAEVKLLSGSMTVEVLCCEQCGKLEFYDPEIPGRS